MSGVSGLRHRPKISRSRRNETLITRTKRASKRSFAAVLAAALVASVLALVASPAGAAASVTATKRWSGTDRYTTANKVANPAGTTTNQGKFVIVSGESYADGLAAAGLAGATGAALLITEPGQLTTSVQTTMTSMSSGVAAANKYVWVIGGENAVKPAVVTQLVAAGWNTTRIAGTDRYATADAVAGYIKTQNGGNIGTMGGYRTCFLANGNGYADALAASGEAYERKLPIFLTDGTTLSAGTSAAIASAKCQKVTVLGGTAAVSDAVKDAAMAVSTVVVIARISGADRYATATAFADETIKVDTTRRVKAILVDGRNFPDGLVASQYAASLNAAIILTNGDTLPSAVSSWMTAKQAWLTDIEAVGGTNAVPAAAVTAAKTAATKAAITATITKHADAGTTWTVTFSERVTQASAQTAANYTIVNKHGAGRNVDGGATLTYTWTAATGVSKMVVTSDAALAPGDVITVNGNAIAGYADNNVKVATTSVSVAANTAAPVPTITAYAAVANAVDKVYVQWNMAVTGFADGDVTVVDQVAGGTNPQVDTCNAIANTLAFACDIHDSEAFVAGDTVKIAAGVATSTATAPVNNVAASSVVVTDATAPTLVSAAYTAPAASTAQGDQASLRVIGNNAANTGASGAGNANGTTKGDVKIEVLAGSALAGIAGNAVKIDIIGVAGATTCAYNATTKIISINVAAAVLAPALTDACNSAATMKDLFRASTIVAAAAYELTNVAATTANGGAGVNMAGGKDTFKVTLTFSEPIALFDAANVDVSTNCATSCANTAVEAVDTTAGAEAVQELSGVIRLNVTALTKPSAGLDKVTMKQTGGSADTKDRNGNVLNLGLAGNPHIKFMNLAG